MDIFYSPHFKKEYKKLPQEIKLLAEKREKLFRSNPFHPSLHTHKLKGRLVNFWAFSINYSCRIIFEFAKKGQIYFHSVGDHDIYD